MQIKEIGTENLNTGQFTGNGNETKEKVESNATQASDASAVEKSNTDTPASQEGYKNPLLDLNPIKRAADVDVKKVEENAKPAEQVNQVIDYTAILSEKTGGKVKSFEEVIEILNKSEELQKSTFKPANDYVAKLNDFVAQGGDPTLFNKVNSIDLEKMSAEDKIKASLAIQNPNLSQDDIDFMFEDEFTKPSEDDDDYERKLKAYNIRIKKSLPTAEQTLTQWKASSLKVENVQTNNNQAEVKAEFEQSVKKSLDSIDKIAVKIGNQGEFEFRISEQERNAAFSSSKSVDAMLMDYVKDGNFDFGSFAKDRVVLKNLNNILHLVREQAVIETEERVARGVKRPDFTGESGRPAASTTKPKALHEQAKENRY